MLQLGSKYLDIELWRSKLAARGNQVCRIEISPNSSSPIYSTGFLIGPDVVITNYHNISGLIRNEVGPSDIVLRFNYKRLRDGKTVDMGTTYHLAPKDWLIDYSPLPQGHRFPELGALDYALLRVEGDPGHAMIPGQESTIIRGWIELLAEDYHFSHGEPMLILQHLRGEPLKIAFGSAAVSDTNPDDILVTYNVNTEPGSSGAPCFNTNLDLIALHQGFSHNLQADQGINMYAILQELTAKGLQDLVTKKAPSTDDESEDGTINSRQFASDPAIIAIVADGETPTTEFKVGVIRNPYTGQKEERMRLKVLKSVAGFMNSLEGGKVLIGVGDDKTIVGINEEYKLVNEKKANRDGYELFLRGILNDNLSIKNPFPLYKIRHHQVEGKDICSITVQPASEPVFVKKQFFVRAGNETKELSGPDLGDYILKRWVSK